jgi:hypothetical protein
VLAPAWLVGSWFSLWWPATIVMMCLIGALVATNVFLLAYEVSGRFRISIPVWAGLAFSSPLMTYAYMIFTELPTGLLVIYAFRRLELGWATNSRWRLLLIGGCIGFIPWLAWRCVLISMSLAVLALLEWWRGAPGGLRHRAHVQSLAWLAGPGILSAIALVSFNLYLFGQPIPTLTVLELGDRSPFHFPWAGWDEFTATVTTAFALLFDRQMGLLTYTPAAGNSGRYSDVALESPGRPSSAWPAGAGNPAVLRHARILRLLEWDLESTGALPDDAGATSGGSVGGVAAIGESRLQADIHVPSRARRVAGTRDADRRAAFVADLLRLGLARRWLRSPVPPGPARSVARVFASG